MKFYGARAHRSGRPLRAAGLAALASLLFLSGCFGGASVPDQLMTLSAVGDAPTPGPRTAAPGQAITILDPTVPQALRTPRIPVYVNETAIQYLKDAQWVENPGPLFRRLMVEVVAARSGRIVLDSTQFTQDPGTRISGQLHRFGVDPGGMEAVATFDATIAREGQNIVSQRFEARVPLAEVTPAAVAPALNQAANQIAEQVAAWVG